MDGILSILTLINELSPLGIIGLLTTIIYLFVAKKGPIKTISDNHLSDLPKMAASLEAVKESSERVELTLLEIRDGINYLKGKGDR